MAYLELREITKEFNGTTALDNISLRIDDEEFLVIVGPSGSGKSTILRLIAGLEKPTHGEIVIDGEIVNDLPPRERNIAMVFQDFSLYPHMNVFDNIAFSLIIKRTKRFEISERVGRIAELMGIENLLHRRPHELSGGEKQRVALAKAIVKEPAIFLLDEPLSSVDAKLRLKLREELLLVHERFKTTILHVTHDQTEAMSVGDRIAILDKGKIQQIGKPIEVYNKPQNIFVADFVGSPPMNFFNGTIKDINSALDIDVNAFTVTLHPTASERENMHKGMKIVLGLRPQHLRLEATFDEKNRIEGTVISIQPLGSEVIVRLHNGEDSFIGIIDSSQSIQQGDRIFFSFDNTKAVLFDADNGTRII